jgi:S-adenosylmethionine:tRNA ribosyltransferase-isomerase
MTPASWPAADPADRKLLSAEFGDRRTHVGTVRDLPHRLNAGDLLVLNDAATFPGSLAATGPDGQPVELRLVRPELDDAWLAILFGAGDWRDDTDDRPAVTSLSPGSVLELAPDWTAEVIRFDDATRHRAVVRFNRQGAAFWQAIYRYGQPIQYRHVQDSLRLWHVQTRYASRPWAAEMPSAGHPLTWEVLLALLRKGVRIATLTHGAGISAAGDPALDGSLPWPERYEIPERTVTAVATARQAGGRVIAVGTSVVRALEGCAEAHGGQVIAGPGETAYRIGPESWRQIVDGLLTGMHEPTASHFQLLQAFAPIEQWRDIYRQAEAAGFQSHEFGDLSLIVSPIRPKRSAYDRRRHTVASGTMY